MTALSFPHRGSCPSVTARLAEGLKTRRQAHGVTQIGLAQAIKSSQSRVAKMEAGDPTVSLDLLVKSLFALGASNRELAAIISRR
jgi:transcriptional regulator with XRE-family HTH domain